MNCSDGKRKIALVGLGSPLDEGDFIGVRLARKIREMIHMGRTSRKYAIRVFEGGSTPENITSEIRAYHPSDLVILDALAAGKARAPLEIIQAGEIGGISFSSHNLPMDVFVRFCEESIGCLPLIIGIDPTETRLARLAEQVMILCMFILSKETDPNSVSNLCWRNRYDVNGWTDEAGGGNP